MELLQPEEQSQESEEGHANLAGAFEPSANPSESSVTSQDVGVNLVGDLGVLKRYLDQQFDRQAELIANLSFQRAHGGGGAVSGAVYGGAVYSGGTGAASLKGEPRPQLKRSSSQQSLASSASITKRLPVNFQESERTSAISNYSVGSGSARRNSARKSFVRGALVEEEERARSTAARVTFMKNGVERKISASSLAWQIKLGDFVRSSFFTNFVMLLIVGNAVLLGVEIDISSRVGQYEVPLWFGIVNTILVFIFVTETILKLLAVGCNEFWKGEECLWNGFDFVIVSLSVAETVIDWLAQTMSSSADGSNSFRIMRALRLARTLRGVRLIRVFRYFSALRGLILSIFSTMGSLLWTLLLLLILFYTFSCIFAQLVTDHCRFATIDLTGDPNAVPVCPVLLEQYWGNVMDSMMTLFMSITGGINWLDAYAPLREVSPIALGLMNLYIVIGFFTILNVVTGVFVNTAIESAGADKDLATLKQLQKKVENMSALQEVFQEIDQHDINGVTLDDLEDALSEEKLGTFLESLGISTDDAWSLFMLIDADHNGIVDLEEFVQGCMQLRGPAKSLQLAKMAYENKLTRQAIKHLHDDVATISRLMKQSLRYRLVRETI